MQSFAKAKAKPPPAPKPTKAAENEDVLMGMSDDGEDDSGPAEKPSASAGVRESRKEREEALRKMMEDTDEDEKESEPESEPEPEPEEAAEPLPPSPVKREPTEVLSEAKGDGRKRGKRRVTRKKRVKDDQGYLGMFFSTAGVFQITFLSPGRLAAVDNPANKALVTVEEQVWESFSEEEAEPPKPVVASGNQSLKQKKPPAKPGQGNIMSFFSKK